MKIIIGHLFYDLLTLYGESGNVKALAYQLKNQGVEYEIKKISLEDNLDSFNLDVIYIGAGSEQNQLRALEYLKQYQDYLQNAIANNVFILATGNSIELFGKSISDESEKIEALNVFDYETVRTQKRIVYECLFKCSEISDKVLGFENQQGYLINNSSPLFTVLKGYGNKLNSGIEGFHKNNFCGTYLLGPVLARNPELLKYIVKEIISSKDRSFIFNEFDLDLDEKAYEQYLKKYE